MEAHHLAKVALFSQGHQLPPELFYIACSSPGYMYVASVCMYVYVYMYIVAPDVASAFWHTGRVFAAYVVFV